MQTNETLYQRSIKRGVPTQRYFFALRAFLAAGAAVPSSFAAAGTATADDDEEEDEEEEEGAAAAAPPRAFTTDAATSSRLASRSLVKGRASDGRENTTLLPTRTSKYPLRVWSAGIKERFIQVTLCSPSIGVVQLETRRCCSYLLGFSGLNLTVALGALVLMSWVSWAAFRPKTCHCLQPCKAVFIRVKKSCKSTYCNVVNTSLTPRQQTAGVAENRISLHMVIMNQRLIAQQRSTLEKS